MKILLIIPIKIYQWFYPKRLRGKCLFKESCSNHVLRMTKDKGFQEGAKSLIYRYKNCRPNYKIIKHDKSILLITCKYNVHEVSELSKCVINNVKKCFEQSAQ